MIIIVANIPFPANNAMSLRVGREAGILSEKEDVIIVCRREKQQPKKEKFFLERKEITVHRFELNYVDPKSPYYVPFFSEAFRAARTFFAISFVIVPLLIKDKRAKIYAINSPETIPLFCYVNAKIFGGKPFVVRFDDLGPELGEESKKINENSLLIKINKAIEKFICQNYEKIISYSYGITELLIKRNQIDKNKVITLIMSPVKIEEGKHIHTRNKIDGKKVFLLSYIGTLQNYDFVLKGFDSLFSSLGRIKEKRKNFVLVIAGEGNAKNDLIKLSKEYGLQKNVVFKGELNEKEIDSLLSEADATILCPPKSSYTQRTFPTKLLSYLALGKVIIAPNYGQYARHFKHRENAMLYNDNSAEDLSNKIIELMENKNLRKKIEKNAVKLFETEFNQKEMEERLRKIF